MFPVGPRIARGQSDALLRIARHERSTLPPTPCYRFLRKNRVKTYPSMNLKGANPVL